MFWGSLVRFVSGVSISMLVFIWINVIRCGGVFCRCFMISVVKVYSSVVVSVRRILNRQFLCGVLLLLWVLMIVSMLVNESFSQFSLCVVIFLLRNVVFSFISMNGWMLQIVVLMVIEVCEQDVNSNIQLLMMNILLRSVSRNVLCFRLLWCRKFSVVQVISSVVKLNMQCQNIMFSMGCLESSISQLMVLQISMVEVIFSVL